MNKISRLLLAGVTSLAVVSPLTAHAAPTVTGTETLLTDPFQQKPGVGTVQIAWFTETEGTTHAVLTGDVAGLSAEQAQQAATDGFPGVNVFKADTMKLSRMYEDAKSFIDAPPAGIEERDIYRHEATVTGLPKTGSTPYRVVTITEKGIALSDTFQAKDAFEPGEHATFLLTSDHQQKNNAPANLQWAKETIGDIDVTLVAGDLINVPDRASEWFDHNGGLAFFEGMQGNASFTSPLSGGTFSGGQIMQNGHTYTAIGNHEVMGRIADQTSLDHAFNYPVPREVAETEYEKVAATVNPTGDATIKERWIEDNSFSTRSYEEIFSMPESQAGGERYYATTVGDTRVITLYSTRIWRGTQAEPDPSKRDVASRYQEKAGTLDSPLEMGHGDFIFEDLTVDSAQYKWLEAELSSPETTGADNVIVMLHESPHSLGNNAMPHFADPVPIEEKNGAGEVIGIRYEYPASGNQLLTSLMPLVDKPGTPVDLVFNGHSHLWNRFKSENGVNFIETSNVGNSYGARHELSADGPRPTPPAPWDPANYMPFGSPGGLEPIVPTEKPFMSPKDPSQAEPYLASNQYSLFTSFDSETGLVSTYIFDGKDASSEPELFDQFSLNSEATGGSSTAAGGSSTAGTIAGVIAGLFAALGLGGVIAAAFGHGGQPIQAQINAALKTLQARLQEMLP